MGTSMSCPTEIQYSSEMDILKFKADWAIASPTLRSFYRENFPIMVETVKIFEAQPKLPYNFPYTFDNPDSITCNALPTAPSGVTLSMMKKQLNDISQFIELGVQFPEVLPDNTPVGVLSTGKVGVVVEKSSEVIQVPSNTALPANAPVVALSNGGIGVVVQTPEKVVPIAQPPVILKDTIKNAKEIGDRINKVDKSYEYDYTIYYILLLLVVIVVVICQINANSNMSANSVPQTTNNGYY